MGYLTTGQAARLCGVHINTIKRWVQSGKLASVRTPGGHWRIPQDSVERLGGLIRGGRARDEHAVKILIIDDDASMIEFARTLIDQAPFKAEVDAASDGYQGLIKLGRIHPDILILDIMMPDINGLEMMHRLRAQTELCGEMRIMVFTGAQDRRLVMRKVQEAKPDTLLLKPATVDEFTQAITSLVQEVEESRAGGEP